MSEAENADLLAGYSWQQLLARRSFIELDALGRAEALLDPDSYRVLAGPFDGLESHGLSRKVSLRKPMTAPSSSAARLTVTPS